MTVDREQIRREAQEFLRVPHFGDDRFRATALANQCLALLAELNQAEARLAKVPALVEAVEAIGEMGRAQVFVWMHFHEKAMANPFGAESEAQAFATSVHTAALAALAAWEAEKSDTAVTGRTGKPEPGVEPRNKEERDAE